MGESHDTAGVTVLVVEDHEDARYMTRMALEGYGYKVLEAADGRRAIEVALRDRPDVILMDISMPVIDGLTATKRIREDERMRETIIVALTAHYEAPYRADALAAGCNAYTTKPIDYNWLNELLGQLLPEDNSHQS